MGKKKGRKAKKSEPTAEAGPNVEGRAESGPPRSQPSTSQISEPKPSVAKPVVTPVSQPLSPQSGPGPSSGVDSAQPPRRQSSTSTKSEKSGADTLASEVQKCFIAPPRDRRPFPKRPGFLTIGTPIQLVANHFLLSVGRKKVFHYDIKIEREVKKDKNVVDKYGEESNAKEKTKNKYANKKATKLNRLVFQTMVEHYSKNANQVFRGINPVYDGQNNMFTSRKLAGTENKAILQLKVELDNQGRKSMFDVNIKLAETKEELDLDILNLYHKGQICDDEVLKKSVLFINTLLRHNLTMSLVPIGQSIFDPNDPTTKIGKYLLLQFGFYSSVRNLMAGPTINIDISAAAFYDPQLSLIKLISIMINGDVSRAPVLSDSHRQKIRKELSQLLVEATHIQYGGAYRKYRVLGLTRGSARDEKFNWVIKNDDGEVISQQMTSVFDYFSNQYKLRLKCPQLPCLEVGTPSYKVKMPIEVCRLAPHQRLRRSMTNFERSQMTSISGQQPPHVRLGKCQQFIEDNFHSGPMGLKNRPFLSEFQINVSQQLLKVGAKVIPAPTLRYGKKSSVTPKFGEWEMHREKVGFLRPARLENWIIINMSFTDEMTAQHIKQLWEAMCAQANQMGMFAAPPHTTITIPRFVPRTTFDGIKEKLKAKSKLNMILFITPDRALPYSNEIYSEIKLLGDVETLGGLTTQCVDKNKILDNLRKRRIVSYLSKLMLKVNVKLGGTNVALVDDTAMPSIFKNKSLMIVGADVNHPAPADRVSGASIAALVGSYDHEFSNYYTSVRMQPKSREEMIRHLDDMIIDLLIKYKSKQNGTLPQHIIFYRDGVSEGQFDHVIDNEYPLLTKAFAKVSVTYKPKVTFIVVQKRHHTRLMTTTRGDNMPPGTVVEEGITHKHDFDFYLCSHAGKLGTSRSAHYYVLADDNGFTANDMCKMTYYLCHIYQRCTKSVSIPAPVYYADLAAYRAKVHAAPHLHDSESGSAINYDGGDESQIETCKEMIKVSAEQKEKLYFC